MTILANGLDSLKVRSIDMIPYLVDKTTGSALSGGTVTFYKDSDRTTLKTIYALEQLTGPPSPTYDYQALPNPLTISGVGTIVDNNGNEVSLFLYPYDGGGALELYYVVIQDANGLTQCTLDAWPYPNVGGTGGGGSGTVNSGSQNQIAWYAANGTTISGLGPATNSVLATNAAGTGVPSLTQQLPSAVQVAVGSLNSGTNASGTTFWRGDGSWSTLSTITGIAVQIVHTSTGTYASGTTILPFDNTIPQNTEGDQYMTITITPLKSTDILVIDAWIQGSTSGNSNCSMALFQDSTANALAASGVSCITGGLVSATLRWVMVAGTTSATTFKIRAGVPTSGTFYFNGALGAQIFGGVASSGMQVTEYSA